MPSLRILLVLLTSLAVRADAEEHLMPTGMQVSTLEHFSEHSNSKSAPAEITETQSQADAVIVTHSNEWQSGEQKSSELTAGFWHDATTTQKSAEPSTRLMPFPVLKHSTKANDSAAEKDFPEDAPSLLSRASFEKRLDAFDARNEAHALILPVNFQVPFDDGSAEMLAIDSEFSMQNSLAFQQNGLADSNELKIGVDFYSAPDFRDGLIIYGRNVAMKYGGYVKADFIYDGDPIDSTDSFDTTTIPVNAEPRTNSRFHARQTRLSFDTRWRGNVDIVRIFVEGDFFSEGNSFRLRHAFGEYGRLLVGQTWTTFTDVAAAPATLDFEGSVSSVNRRQAQARYTFPILGDELTGAVSVEDTKFIIEVPEMVVGESRSPSPDFVARVRWTTDWSQFQAAYLYREVGFQPLRERVITNSAGGFNFTGATLITNQTKAYSQVLFGEGIGSYRMLPDAAPTSPTSAGLLGMFGWMIGVTHDWNDVLSSNFTYAENSLDPVAFQEADDVKQTTYLAVNLLATPLDRVTVGIEYLYGTRENVDGDGAAANRIQTAFIFELP